MELKYLLSLHIQNNQKHVRIWVWIDKTSSNSSLILNTYHSGTCVNNNRTEPDLLDIIQLSSNPVLLPYPCSHFFFDIKFGHRLYSKEKRSTLPLLFWIWSFAKIDIKVKVTTWIGHKCGSYYSAFIKPSGLFFSELCLLAIFDSFQFHLSTSFSSSTNTYFLKHI